MISNTVFKFCSEDPSLIENYDKAIADTENTWHCHHRLEIQGDKRLFAKELKDMNLYFNRPASELIFLTNKEHTRLHGIGKFNPMYNHIYSDETRIKMSKAKENYIPWNKGKHHSEETRRKLKEAWKKRRMEK